MSDETKNGNLQNINEDLYKQNVELAIKNKTLSLLSRLYEISMLALAPEMLAQKITTTIQELLNYELVVLFLHDQEAHVFRPLYFAYSPRFEELSKSLNYPLRNADTVPIEGNIFLEHLVRDKSIFPDANFKEIWSPVVPTEALDILQNKSHIRTIMTFPLVIGSEVIGLMVTGFNREYDTLAPFEKESLWNMSSVTTVALDKTILYEQLRVANVKLESLDKLKTEFLSLASHQLRSPLTAIKGYSSMLLEGSYGPIPEQQKMATERIFQSSQNLSKVIEDLLSVSKIEQGGMQYEFSEIDLTHLAKDLVAELSITAKNKGLELTCECDTPTYSVMADPVKLRQVALNLIDNSIKYTPKGFVKVEVRKGRDPKKVWLTVTDSGIGMSPETQEKLFGKFIRGEGQKVNAGGSGLGLYLAKEIVEAHKGRLWAESPGVNQGATFFLELDLVNED